MPHEPLAMPAIDDHGQLIVACEATSLHGEQGKAVEAHQLCLPGKCQGARCCYAYADPGKAPRPASDQHTVCHAPVRQRGDSRNEVFGVAAADVTMIEGD